MKSPNKDDELAYGRIPRAVAEGMHLADLTRNELAVYFVIMTHANRKYEVRMPIETIAQQAGISVKNVEGAMMRLVGHGLLSANGTVYRLRLP